MKRISTTPGIIALVGMPAGCADLSQTQQRTITGAGGAAAGGIIGAIAGNAGMGAAIGAGVGGTGGFLLGRHNGEPRLRTRPCVGKPRAVDSLKS